MNSKRFVCGKDKNNINRRHRLGIAFGWIFFHFFFLLATTSPVSAVVNGDFETGDLSGWTVSAIDGLASPTTPLISVSSSIGNDFAVFETGEFDDDVFISTLEQSFIISAAEPLLIIDMTFPAASIDPTGIGTSVFSDSYFMSLDDGTDFFDLFLIDEFGTLPDPFGTAPGAVTIGTPLNPTFDLSVTADLSSLAGQTVTLFLDVLSEDDGSQFSLNVDNVRTVARPTNGNAVPEPMTAALGFIGLAALGIMSRRRQF